ncbi:MAG: ATP-binding protein [Myxococcales bacterium]|nr:ATP-binding protein [Myxococcales bacterium]
MIPETLEGWTLPAICKLAASDVAENDSFDFKADLQDADNQRKAVAAFANGRGGFLVFGVTDKREVVGVTNEELPRDFQNKLGAEIDPAVDYKFGPALPVDSQRKVFVCHVPRSLRGPHAVKANGITAFYKRTPGGTTISLTRAEIVAGVTEAMPRRGDLPFLRNELQRIHDRAQQVNATIWREGVRWPLEEIAAGGFCETQVESLLPHVFHEIQGDAGLVRDLNDLRERHRVLTRASEILASKVDRGIHTEADLHDYLRLLRKQLPEVVGAARLAMDRLGKLFP